jgi:hypothetical protein
MDAPRRRVVFGFNVFAQAVLAIAVLVLAVWAADRFKFAADMTGAGRNSLSSRTVQLLRALPADVRITAVFPEPDKRDTLGQKRRRQIQDLLDLYQSAGGAHVGTALLDPTQQKAQTDKLLQRLLELPAYKDEAKPHQEALAKFASLSEQIKSLTADEAKRLDELTRGDAQLSKNRNLGIIRMNLHDLASQAQQVMEKVDQLTHGEMPQYGQAVKAVKEYATSAETFLRDAQGWLTGEGLSISGLTPDLRSFLESAPSRYEPVLAEARGLLDKTKDLKEVKVEELYRNLTQWRTSPPVLVESDREARVVSFWDLWVPPTEPGAPVGPDGDDRVFSGEAAISSAVLQLTQKDKTGVIFVRYGGSQLLMPDFSKMNQMMRQMPRAPYQELNQLLTKAGFQTAEWDVQAQKTPPPVEGATRKIYVVLPPEPPQQNPMQPMPPAGMKPEDRKLVLDAVDQSGMAVFLAGWAQAASPVPGMGGTYEYADYLKTNWGIDVLYKYLTLHFAPHPEKPGTWVPASRQPQVLSTDDVVRFTSHEIGAPLQADRAAFVLVAPLVLPKAESMPAGVKMDVIAEVKPTQDVWGCGDLPGLEEQFKRRQGITPGEKDIRAPFPLAVAATKDAATSQPTATTAPAERKVVVFSSEDFIRDEFAQASGLSQVGNKLVLGPLYPANSDLLINALHWLSGEANRIAVGPRRGEAPRLKTLDEAWAGRLPWLLVGVWPALALVTGVGVWFVRRK